MAQNHRTFRTRFEVVLIRSRTMLLKKGVTLFVYEVTWSSLFVSKWKAGKETYENLTEYAFANARTAPDTFKNGVAEKVRTLLK